MVHLPHPYSQPTNFPLPFTVRASEIAQDSRCAFLESSGWVPETEPVNSRKIARPRRVSLSGIIYSWWRTEDKDEDEDIAQSRARTRAGPLAERNIFFMTVIGVRASLCNWYRCVLAAVSRRSISRRLRAFGRTVYSLWRFVHHQDKPSPSPSLLRLFFLLLLDDSVFFGFALHPSVGVITLDAGKRS